MLTSYWGEGNCQFLRGAYESKGDPPSKNYIELDNILLLDLTH
jgi:hypothetical protein